jgi:hypothetical protein
MSPPEPPTLDPKSGAAPHPTDRMAVLGIVAVFGAHFYPVRMTNFSGTDEWLFLSLGAKGIADSPYSNRPFMLLWHVLAAAAGPGRIGAYHLTHAVCLCLAALAIWRTLRRLAPGCPELAFLAGTITAVYAPADYERLDTVAMLGYAGFAFATALAVLLLVESWERRSAVLLWLAALIALLDVRGVEAGLPLLAAAPALLLLSRREPRPLKTWIAVWGGVVALAAVLAVYPVLRNPRGFYQTAGLHADLHPLRIAGRLLRLFDFHLRPLVTPSIHEWMAPTVACSVLLFVVAFLWLTRARSVSLSRHTAVSAYAAVGGLIAAGLAYFPYALSPAFATPARTQIFSASGIGVFLAAGACLLAGAFPARGRRLVLCLLGAWVVAVGAARTAALQRQWDGWTYYPAQNHTLCQLTDRAGDFVPNTFVVLADESGAWRMTFTFRHALELLYAGHATGGVWESEDRGFLYPFYFAEEGLLSVPMRAIQGPWREPPTRHGYDELVVLHVDGSGALSLLERWPAFLPPLPPGAVYAPHARMLAGPPPAPRLALTPGAAYRAPGLAP